MPLDLDLETTLDPEIRPWLAFAEQRLAEVVLLSRALNEGRAAVADLAERQRDPRASARARSPRVHTRSVERTPRDQGPELEARTSPYVERRPKQAKRIELPLLPTTTIGSFPQTAEVRTLRSRYRRGELDAAQYEAGLRGLIEAAVRLQESVGLDVLVHGEFERNDMVEYFGEQLSGVHRVGERMGPELRLALREAATDLRRREPSVAHDGRLDNATRSRSPTVRSRAC